MTIRLGVGLPAYRGIIASTHAKMWMQVGAKLARIRSSATIGHDQPMIELAMIAAVDVCGVERARNLLVANAMKESVDWLLMIDSDTWVDDGAQLVDMILDAPAYAALVGAPVRIGGDAMERLNIYRWDEKSRVHVPDNLILYEPLVAYQLVDAIGGAAIAINLKRIGNADFRWHYYEDGSSISEDLWFCRQLKMQGQEIYVDTRIKTFHNTRPEVLKSP